MNEHELLDQLALFYIQKKKKPEEAYELAINVIRYVAMEKHKKLDVIIQCLKRINSNSGENERWNTR